MKKMLQVAFVAVLGTVLTLTIGAASPRPASAHTKFECVSWEDRIHDNTWPIFNDYIHATANGADPVPAPPGYWENDGFAALSDIDGTHGEWLSGTAESAHRECTSEG